jgi:predicted DNA-binding transcriptional regulator AlpA
MRKPYMTQQMISRTDEEDRIIRQPELLSLVGFSKSHLVRLEKSGQFPERIKLGDRRVGWSFNEVQRWIKEHKLNRVPEKGDKSQTTQ